MNNLNPSQLSIRRNQEISLGRVQQPMAVCYVMESVGMRQQLAIYYLVPIGFLNLKVKDEIN